MAQGTKFQITLSETVMEKLTKLCADKGVSKSSIIALALDKYFREEVGQSDGQK